MAALMIGANLPDIDVLSIPLGESLTFRRGWTHGPLAMLVLPVLLAAALLGYDRLQSRRGTRPAGRLPVRPAQLFLLALLGVLSHPALDWLNTYGIRLLMPFSERWFYGDTIFIIDPWIWGALGAGVLLSRWGARGARAAAPGAARGAIAAVVGYILLMRIGSHLAHELAIRHAITTVSRPPDRVMAGPVPLNPLKRELIYDFGEAYRFGVLTWTPGPHVTMDAEALPTNLTHPAARAAMADPAIQGFLYWSRFPYFTIREDQAAHLVEVGDARFSRRPGGWASARTRVPESPAPDAF